MLSWWSGKTRIWGTEGPRFEPHSSHPSEVPAAVDPWANRGSVKRGHSPDPCGIKGRYFTGIITLAGWDDGYPMWCQSTNLYKIKTTMPINSTLYHFSDTTHQLRLFLTDLTLGKPWETSIEAPSLKVTNGAHARTLTRTHQGVKLTFRLMSYACVHLMTDDSDDTGRNPGKRPAEYDLTEESRQRVRDIMYPEDFEEAERARIAKRARSWTWYPRTVWDWIIDERVPLLREQTYDNRAHRLPSLEVSLERAFAAHVVRTTREASRARERDEEIMALRKENQRLQEQLDHLWGQVVDEIAELRNRTTQLEERQEEVTDVVQNHGERLVAVEEVAGENQAALQNAWVDQLLMEPEEEPDQGPQFEAVNLKEEDFDEDPDEDPDEEDDNGPADSGDSHSTIV
ncbi:hypothetical protein E3N88_41464 [Mikania micrantha]|uniref:Uncharacterized protein n=1 Tax=Mikania micrantha TaxID=192012 RepID=A0A5N6LQN1_9ASTR|nr:hypothetical protein E3N88_41464 [Mikania micrantha]